MNRREFLSGLFSAAAIVAAGPALSAPITPDWTAAIAKVYQEFWQEHIIYGTAGLRYDEEFPYVHLVRAKDIWEIPELYRALGESL